jgi:hypothetical protein
MNELCPGKMFHCRDFRPKSGLLTVGIFDPSRDFWLSELPTQVRTSGRPNKKVCSDLAFWIPIQTVLNLWKTWKIRLREVSYWYKTTPLYIWEDHGRLSFHLFNHQTNQSTTSTPTLLPSSPTPILFIPWSDDQGWHPRLAADLGQPDDVLALTGSLPSESFDCFFTSLPEN